MKKGLLIAIGVVHLFSLARAQDTAPPSLAQPSKNELLSYDAFAIFKANKYLDFMGRDSVARYIDNVFYDKFDLNNYFDSEKDWKAILSEDTTKYKQDSKSYIYTFTDSTMTETDNYLNPNSRFVNRQKVFDPKGFLRSEKMEDGYKNVVRQSRSIVYTYDADNKVIKMVTYEKTGMPGDNSDSTIVTASYDKNTVLIRSPHGLMRCVFIVDPKSIGFVSKLSGKETAEQFMYSLGNGNIALAKKYCTPQLAAKLDRNKSLSNIMEVWPVKGSIILNAKGQIHEDIWEIEMKGKIKAKYNAKIQLLKTLKGWKVDEFSLSPVKNVN